MVDEEMHVHQSARPFTTPDVRPEVDFEEQQSHTPQLIKYKDESFQHVIIMNTPFIGKAMNVAPLSKIDDGMNDVILQTSSAGSTKLANIMLSQNKGKYFDKKGDNTLKKSL